MHYLKKFLISTVCLGYACILQPAVASEHHSHREHSHKEEKRWHQISAFMELGTGWRRDSIEVLGTVPDAYFPYTLKLKDDANFSQSNFRAGIKFLDLIYGRMDLGYGVMVNDENTFLETFNTGAKMKHPNAHYHDGHAWDWLAATGLNLSFYHNHFELQPEMGYTYKKVRIKRSTDVKIKAPFAGLRFNVNFSKQVQLNVFYNFLFNIEREQYSQFLDTNAGTFVRLPVISGGDAHAYKIGSGLAYKPWKHWGFSLDWEMFHATANQKLANYGTLTHMLEKLHVWWSNQIELSVFYKY